MPMIPRFLTDKELPTTSGLAQQKPERASLLAGQIADSAVPMAEDLVAILNKGLLNDDGDEPADQATAVDGPAVQPVADDRPPHIANLTDAVYVTGRDRALSRQIRDILVRRATQDGDPASPTFTADVERDVAEAQQADRADSPAGISDAALMSRERHDAAMRANAVMQAQAMQEREVMTRAMDELDASADSLVLASRAGGDLETAFAELRVLSDRFTPGLGADVVNGFVEATHRELIEAHVLGLIERGEIDEAQGVLAQYGGELPDGQAAFLERSIARSQQALADAAAREESAIIADLELQARGGADIGWQADQLTEAGTISPADRRRLAQTEREQHARWQLRQDLSALADDAYAGRTRLDPTDTSHRLGALLWYRNTGKEEFASKEPQERIDAIKRAVENFGHIPDELKLDLELRLWSDNLEVVLDAARQINAFAGMPASDDLTQLDVEYADYLTQIAEAGTDVDVIATARRYAGVDSEQPGQDAASDVDASSARPTVTTLMADLIAPEGASPFEKRQIVRWFASLDSEAQAEVVAASVSKLDAFPDWLQSSLRADLRSDDVDIALPAAQKIAALPNFMAQEEFNEAERAYVSRLLQNAAEVDEREEGENAVTLTRAEIGLAPITSPSPADTEAQQDAQAGAATASVAADHQSGRPRIIDLTGLIIPEGTLPAERRKQQSLFESRSPEEQADLIIAAANRRGDLPTQFRDDLVHNLNSDDVDAAVHAARLIHALAHDAFAPTHEAIAPEDLNFANVLRQVADEPNVEDVFGKIRAMREADPFLEFDLRLASAGSAFLQGLVQTGLSPMHALAALQAKWSQETLKRFDAYDQGDYLELLKLNSLLGPLEQAQMMLGLLYAVSGPETREVLRERLTTYSDAENNPLMKTYRIANRFMEENLPVNAKYKDDFFTQVAFAAGSTAAVALVGWATGGVGVPAMLFSSNFQSTFDEAVASGASFEDALKVAELAGFAGQVELIPVSRILRSLNKNSKGAIFDAIIGASADGTEGAMHGLAETVMDNLIRQGYYDPEQGVLDGTLEEVGVGTLMSMIMGFAQELSKRPAAVEIEFTSTVEQQSSFTVQSAIGSQSTVKSTYATENVSGTFVDVQKLGSIPGDLMESMSQQQRMTAEIVLSDGSFIQGIRTSNEWSVRQDGVDLEPVADLLERIDERKGGKLSENMDKALRDGDANAAEAAINMVMEELATNAEAGKIQANENSTTGKLVRAFMAGTLAMVFSVSSDASGDDTGEGGTPSFERGIDGRR